MLQSLVAELQANSAPIGPAHWVLVLAGPRYSRSLGYIMGWLTNAGWFFVNSVCVLFPAQLTMGLIEASHPDYTAKAWHTYLVYVAIDLVFLTLNLPRVFKVMNGLLMGVCVAINFTALFLFISLLVRASPKQSAHFVFVEYVNESGWSDGTTFFIALLPAYACLAAFDNATHLTDELENPAKQVPQVIIGSFAMSFFTTVPMILAFEFCNVDPDSLLEPVGGEPLIQLLLNAFHSKALTIFGMSLIILCISIAGAACLISWSRLYWSFSREGALPFSGRMSRLTSSDSLPLNALLWNTFLTIAIGAISLGSLTAMNALLGAANLCLISALVTALGLTLYRGRKSLNPNRWLNLGGWWGDAIFWIATLWSIFMGIMLSFPLYLPVTAVYMNWASVVFAGIIVLSGIYWVLVFSKNKVVHHDGHYGDHQREVHQPQNA